MQYISVILIVALTVVGRAVSLQCYRCLNTDINECDSSITCPDGQVCHMEYTGHGLFELGCVDKEHCGVDVKLSNATVDIDTDTSQTQNCSECCSTDKCNRNLCEHRISPLCTDEEFDCSSLNSAISICKDIHRAKKVCRKFCGLCNMVDGNWSAWSHWSKCDVTCGNGTKSRIRSCTDPAPHNEGLNCSGESTDVETCFMGQCPVHGGWSEWEEWADCAVTCGVGLQSRMRTCDNPRPELFGDHCFGRNQDVRLCDIKSCAAVGSAFSVDHPYNYSIFHGRNKLTFSRSIYQHGGDFDPSTGTFTCSIPGTYHFSVTLVKKRSSTRVNYVQCYLYKSGSSIIYIYVNPTDDDTDKGHAAVSQSVVLHLNKGDTVYLSACTSPPSTYMEYYSSFTGFLLYPDTYCD